MISLVRSLAYSALASIALAALAKSTCPAHADPYVTIEARSYGGVERRRVDCGLLYRVPGIESLYFTCEFLEQVHNGTVCFDSDDRILPTNDRELLILKLSRAAYNGVTHLARQHNDCVAQAGRLDKKLGKDPDRLYGRNWEAKTGCIIVTAAQACKSAMEAKDKK